MDAFKAGIAYVLIVFAGGFVLGAIRVSFIAPITGQFIAVLIELPFMLALSWLVARWLVRALIVPETMAARATMAVTAFLALMVIEAVFGIAFGKSLAVQWQNLRQPTGLLGLTGQILFALMPILLLRTTRKS